MGRAEDEEGLEVVMNPDPDGELTELEAMIIDALDLQVMEKIADYPIPLTGD